MIYKDKNTGAVVVTDCTLLGDWETVGETASEQQASGDKNWTVQTLKEHLTGLGIEYSSSATKQELLELLPK
ncbi:TPA: hypothetical protein ACGT32_002060 [Streptococcus agalactiae]|nr:hypothetical protein [Streptococcus agalactiae]HEN4322753.1 hypothetical protein [Streptococcus agalactiae]